METLSGWAQSNHIHLAMSEEDTTTEEHQRYTTASFEGGGRGSQAKKFGQPLEAGKSPLKPSERNTALLTLQL